MPKVKTATVHPGGTADETEAAFYEALQAADIDRLMACWSHDDDIVCVHPGGPRIVGANAIRASFETIFSNGSIRSWPEQVRRMEALASSVHNLVERVDVLTPSGPATAHVIATNVYHKTPQGWRMVIHHASPGSQSDMREIGEKSPVLH